jgi:hypothetical protein
MEEWKVGRMEGSGSISYPDFHFSFLQANFTAYYSKFHGNATGAREGSASHAPEVECPPVSIIDSKR